MNPKKYFHLLQKHEQWALPATRIAILLFLCIGLVVVTNYGISWDEPLERNTGLVNVKYIVNLFHLNGFFPQDQYPWGHVEELHDFYDRYYGSWFQVLAISLETLFGLKDIYHIVVLHHIMNFLVYVIGVFYLSKTIQYVFNTPWITLLITLLFLTQPRFFAESFYNSKDLVLISVMLIAIYYITKMLLTKEKNHYWVYASIFTGLAIATRIIAVSLFAEVVVILILDVLFKSENYSSKRSTIFFYIFCTYFFLILFWPYLWSNPLKNFGSSWVTMKKFHWDGMMLFNGEMVRSTALPWNYIPKWILITVPLVLLTGIGAGLVAFIIKLRKIFPLQQNYSQLRIPMLFAGLFIGPIIMIILMHSVVYDGWRHLYFVMSGGILITAYGIWSLTQWTAGKRIITVAVVLICIQICSNLYAIVSLHPYQNVYFNILAGDNLRRSYEMDYWGLSYRQGFEYILNHDTKDTIKVSYPGHWDACNFHLPHPGRKLIYTPFEEADYLLSTYRNHPDNYSDLQEVYTISRGKDTIMSVFKLRKP